MGFDTHITPLDFVGSLAHWFIKLVLYTPAVSLGLIKNNASYVE